MTTSEDSSSGNKGEATKHSGGAKDSSELFGGRPLKSWHAPHEDDDTRLSKAEVPPLPAAPTPVQADTLEPDTTKPLPPKSQQPVSKPPTTTTRPLSSPPATAAPSTPSAGWSAPPDSASLPAHGGPAGPTPAAPPAPAPSKPSVTKDQPPAPETLAPTSPQPVVARSTPPVPATPHAPGGHQSSHAAPVPQAAPPTQAPHSTAAPNQPGHQGHSPQSHVVPGVPHTPVSPSPLSPPHPVETQQTPAPPSYAAPTPLTPPAQTPVSTPPPDVTPATAAPYPQPPARPVAAQQAIPQALPAHPTAHPAPSAALVPEQQFLATADQFRSARSVSFGFKAFSQCAGVFLLLGLMMFGLAFAPTVLDLMAQIAWSMVGISASDFGSFWSLASISVYVLCQVAQLLAVVAIFHAAHQVCQGARPTLRSAFRQLPWASPLLCGAVAAVAVAVVLVPAEFITMMFTSPSRGTMSLIETELNYAMRTDDTEAMLDWLSFIVAIAAYMVGWMLFVGLVIGSLYALCFLYLLPAATSGSDVGLIGLVRSPALVAKRFGSSLLLFVTCASLLTLGFVMCLLPLFLWLLPVCAIATTHAYRMIRGLPVVPELVVGGTPPASSLAQPAYPSAAQPTQRGPAQ